MAVGKPEDILSQYLDRHELALLRDIRKANDTTDPVACLVRHLAKIVENQAEIEEEWTSPGDDDDMLEAVTDFLEHMWEGATVNLALLLLKDEHVTYRKLTGALADQLRQWPGTVQDIGEYNVVRMLDKAILNLLEAEPEG